MTRLKTKEAQYRESLTLEERIGRTSFGLMSNQVWHDDPKRLAFVLSRYKFVDRMLNGKNSALEIPQERKPSFLASVLINCE